ncbi:MAG TPA: hypothetical protein VK638_26205, partial [Edaphobacter sp.]|nr:hypothetical protein [Edaphobacter sp.]
NPIDTGEFGNVHGPYRDSQALPGQIPCRTGMDESIPQTFDIEYKGADWEVVVRIKSTEDGDYPGSLERIFPGNFRSKAGG